MDLSESRGEPFPHYYKRGQMVGKVKNKMKNTSYKAQSIDERAQRKIKEEDNIKEIK